MLDVLKDLIRVPSTSPEETKTLIMYCRDWLEARGIGTTILEKNGFFSLVAKIGSGKKKIILNGHLDVVSAKPEQFEPYEKNGRLYGRGAADMKAGVAVMLSVMENLRKEPLDVAVELQLVSDEEIGGLNGTKYLVEMGYSGDFVICAEPTQLGIALQAKGILQLDIEVPGISAHGSRPWEGENAILKALAIFKAIEELPFAKESSELYAHPSINLAKINGGTVYNKVPDVCIMGLDIRYVPGQKEDEIIKQIQDVAGDSRVVVQAAGNAVNTSLSDPYILALKESTAKFVDEPRLFGQHGSADTRFYAKLHIPAIEFGPTGSNWHGDEEYVEIASMETYRNILLDFIRSLKE